MKNPCLHHPNERFLIIRPWQLAFCHGNKCAATLLGVFEHWHNIKLDMREQNRKANETAQSAGDEPTYDVRLLQWHREEELAEEMFWLFGVKTIRKAIGRLEELGAITVTSNPNPKYGFDRTRFFQLQPLVLQAFIKRHSARHKLGLANIHSTNGKSAAPSGKSAATSTVDNNSSSPKKVLDVTGGPVTGFSEQEEEEEGQAGPAPEQASPSPSHWSKGDPPVTLPETPLLETHFSAHYRKEATPTERENFFGCYFAGAQRLLFNGQLLEKQPLTKAESQRLANDFYNYRCDVHGLHQPDDGDEAYFTEADRRQFEQLALEEPTARFPVLLAVINYLVLEADDLPPGQADAHQQLRMYVWNGKQLRYSWAPAVAALRAMLQAWVHPAKDKMMPPV